MYRNQLVDPNDCITDLFDKSEVTVDYAGDADFAVAGECIIQIVLTDAFGNQTIIDCPFTIVDDHTPPVINGCQDLITLIGTSPAYRDGITVEDDYENKNHYISVNQD